MIAAFVWDRTHLRALRVSPTRKAKAVTSRVFSDGEDRSCANDTRRRRKHVTCERFFRDGIKLWLLIDYGRIRSPLSVTMALPDALVS